MHRDVLAREADAARQQLQQLCDDACAALGVRPPRLEAIVRDGHAAEQILATADEHAADLVVVGTRRRPDTLGSVAERVVHLLGRPTLVGPA